KSLVLIPVLCELGKVDRCKKSRENREQLRCCNWIQLPNGPILETILGVKAGRRYDAHRHHKPGARIFVPIHLIRFRECGAKKLLRKKKNESWAMRRLAAIRGLTSPTLGVGENLLCKIV